jgi:GAF domain-containing protein
MKLIRDQERLNSLRRYQILDTPPDGSFDRIVTVASKMFNMPIALITLVDENRIWFKAKYGLDGVNEIPKAPGLCASAILSDEVYYVENAIQDPRTLENPLVCGDFGLRFYAASPLKTQDGYNIGNICVIDKRPRYLNSEQLGLLKDLGGIVVDEFELRLSALTVHREQEEKIRRLQLEVLQIKEAGQQKCS